MASKEANVKLEECECDCELCVEEEKLKQCKATAKVKKS